MNAVFRKIVVQHLFSKLAYVSAEPDAENPALASYRGKLYRLISSEADT